ncbi:hypothetical protein GCM10022261_08640 [Brevibacterium daeguense]|uniref:Uncharacterized protein n=1 Tax=Brevibacterium daeguense TaxID=909936 RepID=A0ABP8EH83_9MICO
MTPAPTTSTLMLKAWHIGPHAGPPVAQGLRGSSQTRVDEWAEAAEVFESV